MLRKFSDVWRFVSPALHRHEKRFVLPFLISTVALLLLGTLFGYTTVYPAALELPRSGNSELHLAM